MEIGPIYYALSGIIVLFTILALHKIKEGHIGVYYRGGALLKETTEPGFHWMLPIITSCKNIQTMVQTLKVNNISVHY